MDDALLQFLCEHQNQFLSSSEYRKQVDKKLKTIADGCINGDRTMIADNQFPTDLNAEPNYMTELELPVGMAYLSGLLPEDTTWQPGDVCVLLIDRATIKSAVIESSNSQSNVNVSEEDMRKYPDLVKAAVIAEIGRWIENGSWNRKSRS